MRLIRSLMALCFIALGIVFGALNRAPVRVELWFGAFEGRLGLVLLAVLLVGALLGGLVVTLGVVLPLRRAMARARIESASSTERMSRP
jgi:lipopolysaccharide assembly protein A